MHVNGSSRVKKHVPLLQQPPQRLQLQRPQPLPQLLPQPVQQQVQRHLQLQPQRESMFIQQQLLLKRQASNLRSIAMCLTPVGCVRWKISSILSVLNFVQKIDMTMTSHHTKDVFANTRSALGHKRAKNAPRTFQTQHQVIHFLIIIMI